MNAEEFIGKKIGRFIIKQSIGEGAFSSVFLAEERMHRKKKSKDNNSNDKNEEADKNNTINEKMEEKKDKDETDSKDNNHKEHKHRPHRLVACKIIPRKKIEAKKMTTRLDQEIKVHQLMHHPNVVQLIDVHKDENYYYIFLEYCGGGELFDVVINKQKLAEDEAAIYFKQILIGLKYIHSLRVAHRDMKPENVLLDEFGHVKIADFGLSKLLDEKSGGLAKTPCGSPCYASPECISGKQYDGRTNDVWSCGVILYAITTGLLPWTKRNQKELFKQIQRGEYSVPQYLSEPCADLIRKLLTVDNTKRITIDEALQHPFLKDVQIPTDNVLNHKFVSLRKVDRFLGFDKDFHIQKMINGMNPQQSGTDGNFKLDFSNVKLLIETDDEKKSNEMNKSILNNRNLIRTISRSKLLLSLPNDEEQVDESAKNNNVLRKRPPLPPNAIKKDAATNIVAPVLAARKDIQNGNLQNIVSPNSALRRSQQGPYKVVY